MRAGNRPSKTQRVEGEISIVQSIQLGYSRSLGSATSDEANKRAMLRAEWTITARRAVLRLAQMKRRYFGTLQADHDFFRYNLELQTLSDGRKFQDNFPNTAGTDSKISQ